MKLNIKDINGKKIGDVSVNKEVFGIKPNLAVVRQAVLSESVSYTHLTLPTNREV